MIKKFILILSLFIFNCQGQNKFKKESTEQKKLRQDSLIAKYVKNCAEKYNYKYQMHEWQNCLDKGLEQDSTVAYFWQQKAMPYFKAKKYEVGMQFLDKAVNLDQKAWLSYRAFIKCIFVKSYKESILDFEKAINMEGNSYIMDHTYKFYIALSYLQLNEYQKAETIFKQDIENQENKWGEAHLLDLFYYGISLYEQQYWGKAITQFDKSLKQYPNFSDANYYKAICFNRLKKFKESTKTFEKAKLDAKNGNTISEANSIYEIYPYQVRW